VVHGWLCLTLVAACSCGHGCGLLVALLVPLLAALGILLRILDGNVG
jgi:hypothetical protein